MLLHLIPSLQTTLSPSAHAALGMSLRSSQASLDSGYVLVELSLMFSFVGDSKEGSFAATHFTNLQFPSEDPNWYPFVYFSVCGTSQGHPGSFTVDTVAPG